MRSAPVRTSAVALALSCLTRLAVAQTPAPTAAPPPPPPEAAPAGAPVPPTAAAHAADHDCAEPAPTPPPAAPPSAPITLTPLAHPAAAPTPLVNVMSKFSATVYGFVEADSIFDSTQSFNDLAGNAAILHTPAPTTATPNPTPVYGAEHGRTTFSARNSRFGVKLKGPETDTVKTSAIFECDFLGNQPQGMPSPVPARRLSPKGRSTPAPCSACATTTLKMETPYIDLLAGQYWQLFGFQALFHPNTVEMQGIPGQISSRSPQFRLSHTFKTDAVERRARRRRVPPAAA